MSIDNSKRKPAFRCQAVPVLGMEDIFTTCIDRAHSDACSRDEREGLMAAFD